MVRMNLAKSKVPVARWTVGDHGYQQATSPRDQLLGSQATPVEKTDGSGKNEKWKQTPASRPQSARTEAKTFLTENTGMVDRTLTLDYMTEGLPQYTLQPRATTRVINSVGPTFAGHILITPRERPQSAAASGMSARGNAAPPDSPHPRPPPGRPQSAQVRRGSSRTSAPQRALPGSTPRALVHGSLRNERSEVADGGVISMSEPPNQRLMQEMQSPGMPAAGTRVHHGRVPPDHHRHNYVDIPQTRSAPRAKSAPGPKEADTHVSSSRSDYSELQRRRKQHLQSLRTNLRVGMLTKINTWKAHETEGRPSAPGNESAKDGSQMQPEAKPIHPHSAQRRKLIEREARTLHEEEHYVELACEAQYTGLRNLNGEIDAANTFDKRHMGAAHFTQGRLATLKCVPTSMAHANGFDSGVNAIRRNRYFLHETYDPYAVVTPHHHRRITHNKHRFHKPWSLDASIWAPRQEHGNSHDYFETSAALQQMLAVDWEMARKHHWLATRICKVQMTKEQRHDLGIDVDQELALTAPCVEAVHDMLKRHANLVYNMFDYYAMMDQKLSGGILSGDIFSISLGIFIKFVSEQKIMDATVPELTYGAMEHIFSIVDAVDAESERKDRHNKSKGLGRFEFLQTVVLLAIHKYCRSSKPGSQTHKGLKEFSGNVAEAVEHLCNEHLLAEAPPMRQPGTANWFRKRYCYREDVSDVLERYKPTLLSLYKTYRKSTMQSMETLHDHKHMEVDEWLLFLQHAGLFELRMVSLNTALEAFQWSRIRSITSLSSAQEIRLRGLYFEDFLEALVRLSTVVALPTQQEVEDGGAADAGEFLLALYSRGSAKTYNAFLMARKTNWNEPPRIRVYRCVTFFLDLIEDVIFANCGHNAEKKGEHCMVPAKVVERFYQRRMDAEDGAMIQTPHSKIDEDALVRAMESIEMHLIDLLHSNPAFQHLSHGEVIKLREAMLIGTYSDEEYIVEQGGVGDCFFLITHGAAEVLRYDPADPDKEEFLLNTLGEGDCFGEAALLHNTTRNATVMAKGEVHALYISRDGFESVLGPLADYKLAHYEEVKHDVEMLAEGELGQMLEANESVEGHDSPILDALDERTLQ